MAPPVRSLADVVRGRAPSRLRLLAPLRYLAITHPEKLAYDIIAPIACAIFLTIIYFITTPRVPIFGDIGILKYTRDLLAIVVPFLMAALASVAMGAPGLHIDRRFPGVQLMFDGRALTARQFVCYLLGYLSFVGLVTLILTVVAQISLPVFSNLLNSHHDIIHAAKILGVFVLFFLISVIIVTSFWALYFLTDIVNRQATEVAPATRVEDLQD
jgi:hypothetical protein